MKCGDWLRVSVNCDIIFIHVDVITHTLSSPEAHQAPPLQTAAVDHLMEQ